MITIISNCKQPDVYFYTLFILILRLFLLILKTFRCLLSSCVFTLFFFLHILVSMCKVYVQKNEINKLSINQIEFCSNEIVDNEFDLTVLADRMRVAENLLSTELRLNGSSSYKVNTGFVSRKNVRI